jgi:hypothetical protein
MLTRRQQLVLLLDWSDPQGKSGRGRVAAYLAGAVVGVAVAVALIVGIFPGA